MFNRLNASLFWVVLAASTAGADVPSPVDTLGSADGRNWASYGRTYSEDHYSPLDQIDQRNIDHLGLAWSFDLQPGNTVTQPIEVNGVIYIAMGYSVVHAIDASSGKLLWRYDPEVYKTAHHKMHAGWGSRGIAWWDNKVYAVTVDGFAIALDARTGALLWRVPTLQSDDSTYVTGAPFVFGGKLIIGNAGDFGAMRGVVTALDAETGKLLWRFWTVPGDPAKGFENKAMEMAAKTWHGEWWKYGANGAPWNAFAYDAQTDTLFFGTGNGSPYDHSVRSQGQGDNLFVSSVIALSASTGEYKWHYQENPGEEWDFDATQDLELADLEIGGTVRKVLMTAGKNGFDYVIDRNTGKLISAKPFVPVNWASGIDMTTGRPMETAQARYGTKPVVISPTAVGGHSWQAMSYSPRTRITYIPANELSAAYSQTSVGLDPPSDVSYWMGANIDMSVKSAQRATSLLLAWDPVQQKELWRVREPRMIPAAVLATGGDLVFQGAIDGTFNAYSALDGKRVWTFDARAPVISPPMSFAVSGRQYVTVLTGMGTSPSLWGSMILRYRWDYGTLARRVLTFALDGRSELPPRRYPGWTKIQDPTFKRDDALAATGAGIFAVHCVTCHGGGAVSAGMAPDLRRSSVPLSPDAFRSVVHDGALLKLGMPQFDEFDDAQLDAIRQYIRAQAHDPRLEVESSGPVSPD